MGYFVGGMDSYFVIVVHDAEDKMWERILRRINKQGCRLCESLVARVNTIFFFFFLLEKNFSSSGKI